MILKLTESGAFTKSGSITAIATSFNNLSNLEIPAKSSRANLGVRGYTVNKSKKIRLNNFSNNQNEQAKRKDKIRKKGRKGKREKDRGQSIFGICRRKIFNSSVERVLRSQRSVGNSHSIIFVPVLDRT